MTARGDSNLLAALACKINDLNQILHALWIEGKLRLTTRGAPPIFPGLLAAVIYLRRR
jgi:hypothetical protein